MERHRPEARGKLTLAATVTEAGRRHGDRPAVVAPDGWRLSYRELDRLSDEVAVGLRHHGVGAGDVVCLAFPSSPEYLVAYAAAAKVGAITAGVNPRLAPAQRAELVSAAGATLTVGTPELLDGAGADSVAVDLADGADACLEALRRSGAQRDHYPASSDHPVAVVFTSGTTGAPRGAVFTAAQLGAIAEMDAGSRWGGGGPMLASTELAHVGVMTKLPWYLMAGATLHLLRRWRAGDALHVISRERMSSVGAIAPQVALMLRHPGFDGFDLSAVRTVVAGGAPSPPSLIVEARERFAAAYSVRYSSTESGGVGTATAFDADDEEALHTVGRPRPGVQVEVRDDGGAPVPHGDVGAVWLRSRAVMAGYWRDNAATAAALVDGWLRTDDLGRLDERGCLRLAGRRGDAFIRGGYNVHPETVEAALGGHPAVRDVAVVPVADDVLGQIGVAVVVPVDPAAPPSLEELRADAAGRLAHHELPERLHVLADLPRTALHKLDRRRLRDEVVTAIADTSAGATGPSVREPRLERRA